MAVEKLNDKWFRFIGVPVIGLMGHIIFFNRNDSGPERFGFLTIYILSVAETVLLWEANRQVVLHYRKRFSGLQQTPKRIIITLAVCSLVTVLLRSLNIYLYDQSFFWGYQFPLEAYLHSIFVALLFVVVIAGSYEGIYYFRMWKNTAVEAEALRAEHLQTQLDLLKVQLNPHFLFNSLGSLSSLIDESPGRAKAFLEQLSMVYRYLLQAHDKSLTSLKEELDFIISYSQMLKTRFGEGLLLSMQVTHKAHQEYLLPPLTVQVLLENAVKHNAVLPHRPLKVSIHTDTAGYLVVTNNLQKKKSPVYSNKKGLANIIAKYKFLNQPDIQIEETPDHFCVRVPLIKSKYHAGIDY